MCSQKCIYNGRLFILIIIVVEATASSVEGTLSHENQDVYKIKVDPTRLQFTDVYKHKSKIRPKPVTNLRDRTIRNSTVTKSPQLKKWQVGRVSRKQYEIINMLWRKRNEFSDMEISTASYYPGHSLQRFMKRPPTVASSTPSFIEFYYLDEIDERTKDITRVSQLSKEEKTLKFRSGYLDYPVFAFRINDPNYLRPTASSLMAPNADITRKTILSSSAQLRINNNTHSSVTVQKIMTDFSNISATTVFNLNSNFTKTDTPNIINDETCPLTTDALIAINNVSLSAKPGTHLSTILPVSKPTTVYDKIKFFEMYDRNTPLPYYFDGKPNFDYNKIGINGNSLNNNQKILLEHVDQDTQLSKKHKTKHAKKHIIETNRQDTKEIKNTILKPVSFNLTTEKRSNKTNLQVMESLLSQSKIKDVSVISKVAEWSDHSYMAAYIYEPSQVHCDAAGISPHWLVTSGSCLSRHHKNPGGEGRSAFVAYCGSTWWDSERVAYVKHSVVHPRYHQRDKKRRNMYNIGLVQVVISMSTCPGWAPVSLMSHQFTADPEGSLAYAVGWGLDRYDTRYASNDLPKYPLMSYESRVYSDSCPGNLGYAKTKEIFEDRSMKSVYCLSLPPYSGEATDPIHGSMLLVGGKLCAIYIQEERRPTGEQSAQYTSVWRLGPWLFNTAREPDESEAFVF